MLAISVSRVASKEPSHWVPGPHFNDSTLEGVKGLMLPGITRALSGERLIVGLEDKQIQGISFDSVFFYWPSLLINDN